MCISSKRGKMADYYDYHKLLDSIFATPSLDAKRLPAPRYFSKVPGYPRWFNVKFDEDEALYAYKLLDDYRSGDVEIIV